MKNAIANPAYIGTRLNDLEDVGTALRRVAGRVPTGKVVIRVAS